MDPNLSGSCSLGYHSRSDHMAVNGKGAESRQGRENHHPDSGVLRTQLAIPQPPLEPCPTHQGPVEHGSQVDHVVQPRIALNQLARQSHLQHYRSNDEGSTSSQGH
jgi:hypothetical protein